MKKVIVFLSFLLLISNLLKAQHYTWTKLDTNDGLSSNIVHTIFAENDTTIWIGTNKGLNLYDGNDISFYNESNSNLANDSIYEIIKTQNKIWVRTKIGLSSFDGNNFTNYDSTNGLLSNDIKDLCFTSNGDL